MYKFFKRVIDIILAFIMLVIFSPVMLVISIIIKLDGGPIFFRQVRSGKYGVEFHLYKFRSMSVNNDMFDNTCVDSITKIGKFLRKTSLDELGQLINILKGDMSFIGPRPWIVEYAELFNYDQIKRLDVLPGITGYAQAMGRNNIDVLSKIKYDLEYVDNMSLLFDIKVVFLTIKTVFEQDGVDIGKSGIHNELFSLMNQK